MAGGWIKLHRKTMENPIICKDSEYFYVWCYLLLNATHKEYDAVFKGEKITLKPGQLLTGRKSISEKLKINESKIKRILIDFESDQQIDRQRSNRNSLITIKNWNKYQESDQQNDQKMTSYRPASDHKQECKNKRTIYIDFFDTFWSAYPKKIGKATAQKSFIKLKVDKELLKDMINALEVQKQSRQ